MKFENLPLSSEEQLIHDRALIASRTHKKCELDLISIIDDVDRLRLFEKFGKTSTYVYCTTLLGLSESVTYNLQAIARKSRVVPELKLAIEEGEISIGNAGRLVSQITPENQKEWIEKAHNSSKAKLERELAAVNPKKRKRSVRKPVDKTHTRCSTDVPNRLLEKQKRVRELECQRTRKVITELDALEAALDFYLERNDPVLKAKRAAARTNAKRAESESMCGTPAEKVVPPAGPVKFRTNSSNSRNRKPLDAQTRDAVNQRDGRCCQAEMEDGSICGERHWVEIHHKIEVSMGGTNELENLITLCSAHHRIHHSRLENPTAPYIIH